MMPDPQYIDFGGEQFDCDNLHYESLGTYVDLRHRADIGECGNLIGYSRTSSRWLVLLDSERMVAVDDAIVNDTSIEVAPGLYVFRTKFPSLNAWNTALAWCRRFYSRDLTGWIKQIVDPTDSDRLLPDRYHVAKMNAQGLVAYASWPLRDQQWDVEAAKSEIMRSFTKDISESETGKAYVSSMGYGGLWAAYYVSAQLGSINQWAWSVAVPQRPEKTMNGIAQSYDAACQQIRDWIHQQTIISNV